MTAQEKETAWELICKVLNESRDAASKVQGKNERARKARTVFGRYKREIKTHGFRGVPVDNVIRVEHVERDAPTVLRDAQIRMGLAPVKLIKRVDNAQLVSVGEALAQA